MDSSANDIPTSLKQGGEALVGDEKASKRQLSASAIDWTAIFMRCPELSPPGYEDAVRTANEKIARFKQEEIMVSEQKLKPVQKKKKRRR